MIAKGGKFLYNILKKGKVDNVQNLGKDNQGRKDNSANNL